LLNTEFADFEYVKTLGLKIIAGRDYSPGFPTDSTRAVLINRAAAARLGYTPEQAIGKWIKSVSHDSLRRSIIGVVEDYHFKSLKEAITPLVISTSNDRRLVLIKLRTHNLPAAVADIKKVYAGLVPDWPFESTFLDDNLNRLYKSEMRQEMILSIFSFIAILIACLGLLGLASYTAIKRTKEIGVRKVLGSSVQGIVVLLSKDLLKPVLLGTLIAVPIGYYITSKWLQGFVYRISPQWWMFALAAAVALMIALVTVSIQAIKAAIANPVKSLRTE
jgi:putative ABC transport system permease protein